MSRKDIPFNFEGRLQRFFYHVAVLPSMESGLNTKGNTLRFRRRHPPCIPMPAHAGTTGLAHRKPAAFPRPAASWGWDSDLEKILLRLHLCSKYPAITVNSGQISPASAFYRVQSVMIRSTSLSLSMNWKTYAGCSTSNMCLDSAMDNYPTYRIAPKQGNAEGPSSTLNDKMRPAKNNS